MYIIGTIIGTIGLIMAMICGGGETFLDCVLCGGLGLSMLILGGVLMNVSDALDEKKKEEINDREDSTI